MAENDGYNDLAKVIHGRILKKRLGIVIPIWLLILDRFSLMAV